MRLTDALTQDIIRHVINGEDYRIEIVSLINALFLEYAVEFFKKVANAKLDNKEISVDWYKKEFLHESLPSEDLIIHAGLNKKTVANMYESTRREIILEEIPKHYDKLLQLIETLVESSDIDLMLTIKLQTVAVDLTFNESLVVINMIAVKRAALRGGAWSTAGKQVEIPLMKTLCKLFNVPANHYVTKGLTKEGREVDFHLIGANGENYRCEVKLMGQGNPESADAVIARDTTVFVADKLSDLNKQQLTTRGIHWVELRAEEGYKRFYTILQALRIPAADFTGDVNHALDTSLEDLFPAVK